MVPAFFFVSFCFRGVTFAGVNTSHIQVSFSEVQYIESSDRRKYRKEAMHTLSARVITQRRRQCLVSVSGAPKVHSIFILEWKHHSLTAGLCRLFDQIPILSIASFARSILACPRAPSSTCCCFPCQNRTSYACCGRRT
jgi:hypothetical protein